MDLHRVSIWSACKGRNTYSSEMETQRNVTVFNAADPGIRPCRYESVPGQGFGQRGPRGIWVHIVDGLSSPARTRPRTPVPVTCIQVFWVTSQYWLVTTNLLTHANAMFHQSSHLAFYQWMMYHPHESSPDKFSIRIPRTTNKLHQQQLFQRKPTPLYQKYWEPDTAVCISTSCNFNVEQFLDTCYPVPVLF